jgi:hypothetical protein
MTLRQSSFGRPTREFSIEGRSLRLRHSSLRSRYSIDLPLASLRDEIDEYRHVAWAWFFVGAGAIAFLGYYLYAGLPLGAPGVMFAIVYVSLGIYSFHSAWQRSGDFVVVQADVKRNRRVIAIRREIPNRFAVDAFVNELKDAIRREKAAEPGATDNLDGA